MVKLFMNKTDLPDYLEKLLKKIWEESKPISVFLYGSIARDDFENDSDYEVGVIYQKEKKWSRQQLNNLHNFGNVKIYPFIEQDLAENKIDTPFPKAFFLLTLLQTSNLIYGKEIKEIIKNVEVNKNDIYEAIGFCLGRAYMAVVSSRQSDWIAVRDGFTKSALYGLQILIYVKTGKLVFSYKEMKEQSDNFIDNDYQELIDHVIEVRKGNSAVDSQLLYKNISFLNSVLSVL